MTIKENYTKNFTFKVKDFEHMKWKYENYKPRWQKYISLNDADAYSMLECDVWSMLNNSQYQYRYFLSMNKEDMKPRTFANRVRTFINYQSYNYNFLSYKELWFSDSQARSCAIRFYVENYNAINNKMVEFMEDFIQSTCYSEEYFID